MIEVGKGGEHKLSQSGKSIASTAWGGQYAGAVDKKVSREKTVTWVQSIANQRQYL